MSGSGTRRISCSSTKPATAPSASPTPISRRNSQTTSAAPASGTVASSTIPIISAIPTGIVESRLSLQNRAGAAFDLLPCEDGERHGGIGRGEGRAEQEGDSPVEAEHVMRGDAHEWSGPECPEHPEDRDRNGGGAEPGETHAHASVEQDHDQRERGDPLHVDEGEQ